MGMSAQILALGPFDPALIPHLAHPPQHYAQVPPGTMILEPTAPMTTGSTTGRELAAAVGASAWDFSTHALDPARFDWPALALALGRFVPDDATRDACLARIRALAAAGFRFWFLPNG